MTITLLDGGMGQELMKRSGDAPTALWATRVMLDHPGLVSEIHTDYFNAGADIATANTYAILRDRLTGTGLEDQFELLLDAAMAEAEAAQEANGGGKIAGAMGPLGQSYRADVMPPHAEAVALYREIAARIGPRADMLIAETVVSLAHAAAVLEATEGYPMWLAVSVDDEDGTKLRSGEPVAGLAPLLERRMPDAVLCNCSAPEAIGATLEVFKTFDLPFGAYANGFKEITKAFLGAKPTVDTLVAREDVTPARYADFAAQWIEQGATILGGCCEVGPAHIAELKRRFG